MGTCKTCGKKCEGEYCFKHKPRKKLPARKVKLGILSQELVDECKKEIEEMQQFFLKIWKKKLHYSEVSMDYLGKEPLSVFFHHILPKSKYPQAEFDEENIILLTLQEHDQVEMDPTRYEEINKRREKLKKKYEIT